MPLSQRHDAREGGWPQKRSMCPGSLPDRTLLRSLWDRRTNALLGGGGAEVTDPEREDRIVRTVGGGRARHCRGCERPANVNHRARAAASAVTHRAVAASVRDDPTAMAVWPP